MKKLISTIMSLAVACAGLTAVNAGAIAELPFDDTFADYVELYHIEDDLNPHSVFVQTLTGENGEPVRHYRQVRYKEGRVNIGVYSDSDVADERITDILSSCGVTNFRTEYEYGIMSYFGTVPDDFSYAREIRNKITEISDLHLFSLYVYGGGMYASGSGYILFGSPTYYHWGVLEEQLDGLAEYIKEKNLDFTFERGKLVHEANDSLEGKYKYDLYKCNLIPNYDIDFDEHLQIAADIAETFGIEIPIVYQASAETVVSASGDIDVLNSIDGDANGDGEMNIADATAIVQAIGNKDKYGLTAQGEFNADVDGNGLTGADAVAIQQKLVEMGMPE
ncbi:MAG: dockerin type I repeat-containing protein [Ruminococcus sp.]|nr:dockerin type I repeat-containing protein [Ruminococcus sp.]